MHNLRPSWGPLLSVTYASISGARSKPRPMGVHGAGPPSLSTQLISETALPLSDPHGPSVQPRCWPRGAPSSRSALPEHLRKVPASHADVTLPGSPPYTLSTPPSPPPSPPPSRTEDLSNWGKLLLSFPVSSEQSVFFFFFFKPSKGLGFCFQRSEGKSLLQPSHEEGPQSQLVSAEWGRGGGRRQEKNRD